MAKQVAKRAQVAKNQIKAFLKSHGHANQRVDTIVDSAGTGVQGICLIHGVSEQEYAQGKRR